MSTKTHSLIKSQILIASAEGHFLITSLQVLACMSIITSVHIITNYYCTIWRTSQKPCHRNYLSSLTSVILVV